MMVTGQCLVEIAARRSTSCDQNPEETPDVLVERRHVLFQQVYNVMDGDLPRAS